MEIVLATLKMSYIPDYPCLNSVLSTKYVRSWFLANLRYKSQNRTHLPVHIYLVLAPYTVAPIFMHYSTEFQKLISYNILTLYVTCTVYFIDSCFICHSNVLSLVFCLPFFNLLRSIHVFSQSFCTFFISLCFCVVVLRFYFILFFIYFPSL